MYKKKDKKLININKYPIIMVNITTKGEKNEFH